MWYCKILIFCVPQENKFQEGEQVPDCSGWGLAGLELYEACGFVLPLGQDFARLEELLDGSARSHLRHLWLVWVRPVLKEMEGRFQ